MCYLPVLHVSGYSVLPSCSESGELSPEAVTITRHITAGLQTLVEGDEAAGIEETHRLEGYQ